MIENIKKYSALSFLGVHCKSNKQLKNPFKMMIVFKKQQQKTATMCTVFGIII